MATQTTSTFLQRPFRTYIWQHKRAFALGLGSLFLTNAFDAFPPLLIGRAIDQLTGPRTSLLLTLGILILVTAALSFFRYWWRIFWGRFHHSVADDLRNRIMDHFLELGPSYFQKTQIGKAMSLITSDVNVFRMAIGPGVLILVDGISILLLVPPVMCLISPAWTFKTLCLMPLAPFFVIFIMRKLNALYTTRQNQFADMSGVAQEIVAGIRVIKSFALELHQIRYFNRFSRNYELACNQVAKVDSTFVPVLELFVSIGSVILLLLAAPEVVAGQVTIGQFVAFFQYVQRMVWPMNSIGIGITHIEQGKAAFQRIRELLETEPIVRDSGIETVATFESLEVRNLSFGFGDRLILNDVSFRLRAGEKLGILGPTGAGKSILLDLIFRLHKAPPNSLFINDIPVERIQLASLRRLFAVVPQEVFLFQDTLHDNLRLGHDDVDDDRISQALHASALQGEIDNLAAGLDTELGERGVNLSGGQKQRLTMARAWLKRAPILVLDDSLSAVDSKTEHHILEQIKTAQPNQTLMVISHRLSALEGMDHILVMNEGQVEAFGDYRKIRSTSTTVKKLMALQEESLA